MLVLTRKPGEEIVINDEITLTVVTIEGGRVRLGIKAPREMSVDRGEIHKRKIEFVDARTEFKVAPMFTKSQPRTNRLHSFS